MMGYDYHIVYRVSVDDASEEDALGSDPIVDNEEIVVN